MMFNDIEDSNGHGTQVLALRAHDAAHVIAVKVLVSNGSGWRMADVVECVVWRWRRGPRLVAEFMSLPITNDQLRI